MNIMIIPGRPPMAGYTMQDKAFATKINEVSTSLTYVATAEIGTQLAANMWRAQKIEKTGNITLITWAGGGDFNQVATDLTALTYL